MRISDRCPFVLHVDRHDDTGSLPPGAVGASAVQRQWIGLSATGDTVTVTPSAPAFLETLALEVGFLQRNLEIAEQFSADDMAATFIRGFGGLVFTVGQISVFEYHGQNLKCVVKSVSVLELAAEQHRRGGGAPGGGAGRTDSGVVMEKTDITFLKDPTSKIKIKSSAKKAAPNAILAPNFKFEDMGIGGLDQEFSAIFRRAFASRVFPPGLVEKLGIQHVKGAWWVFERIVTSILRLLGV
jgi:vesicle-fusing ATPase